MLRHFAKTFQWKHILVSCFWQYLFLNYVIFQLKLCFKDLIKQSFFPIIQTIENLRKLNFADFNQRLAIYNVFTKNNLYGKWMTYSYIPNDHTLSIINKIGFSNSRKACNVDLHIFNSVVSFPSRPVDEPK